MALARGLTSSKVSRLNGPISPGRWQGEQCLKTTGATSLLKVTRSCAPVEAGRTVSPIASNRAERRTLAFTPRIMTAAPGPWLDISSGACLNKLPPEGGRLRARLKVADRADGER